MRIARGNVAVVTLPGRIISISLLEHEVSLDPSIHLVPFSVISNIGHLKSKISEIINQNISTCSELLTTSKPFYGKNNLEKCIFIIKDLTQMETIQGLNNK